jgi:hypothetical protein
MGEYSKDASTRELALRKELKESRREIILPSEIEMNFRELIHQATVDLQHKLASGTAGQKDLSSLLKLIEGHCKLENLDLKRQEIQQGEVSEEEIRKILEKVEAANVLNETSN